MTLTRNTLYPVSGSHLPRRAMQQRTLRGTLAVRAIRLNAIGPLG
jgi:hypothetical protein